MSGDEPWLVAVVTADPAFLRRIQEGLGTARYDDRTVALTSAASPLELVSMLHDDVEPTIIIADSGGDQHAIDALVTPLYEAFDCGRTQVILAVDDAESESGNLDTLDASRCLVVRRTDLTGNVLQRHVRKSLRLYRTIQRLETERDNALADMRDGQEKLVQSEKLATLGQMTAGIAHEINNPLNFVNNFSESTGELVQELAEKFSAVTDSIDPGARDEIRQLLADIETLSERTLENGRRAVNIIRSMLAHSRGQSRHMEITDINTMLNQIVQLSYHGMRALNKTFNIKIEKDFDDTLPRIQIFAQDISRVFLNILNNAFYATDLKKNNGDGDYSPLLRVSTERTDAFARIRIWDNGPGIPADVYDKIFKPFFTTKPAGAGTGLGLSISYDIVVDEHGGKLEVLTEDGAFTEFIINLPIDQDP